MRDDLAQQIIAKDIFTAANRAVHEGALLAAAAKDAGLTISTKSAVTSN